jgi:hypothetical protein
VCRYNTQDERHEETAMPSKDMFSNIRGNTVRQKRMKRQLLRKYICSLSLLPYDTFPLSVCCNMSVLFLSNVV